MIKLNKSILAIVIALFMVFAFLGTGMAKQGDRVWSASADGWDTIGFNPGVDGSGASTFGVSFPYDPNQQPVVVYINATGKAAGDDLDIYGYISRNTGYTTLTYPFHGGNTNWVKVVSDAVFDYAGVSYFAIDDGAGTVGWGEFQENKHGTYLQVVAGASNFSQGPTHGIPDLSGVSFPEGSRLFPLFRIGTRTVGAATVQTDSDTGLFAAAQGSPLVAIIKSGTGDNAQGSGVTIHGVTVRYEQ